jgi:hypothetical protein
MATKAFNSLAYARKLKEAGVPAIQAEDQAEFIADAFQSNIDDLVTKESLDLRLTEMETRFDAKLDQKFSSLTWMITVGFTVLVIPQLRDVFG